MVNTNDIQEKEALYDKKFECPICGSEIKAKTIRTGKCKLDSTDPDLRPVYHNIDSLKYDALMCESCGYASLKKFFDTPVLPVQLKNIKEKICANYKGQPSHSEILSYDEAIRMHKMALLSSMVKNAPISEQAYTALKIAWLLRGKQEGTEEELTYLAKAYFGFTEAYKMEDFPICGMDEPTLCYLIAILGYETEHYSEAKRWVSMVITAHGASDRVKEKARDLKDQLSKIETEEE